MSSIVAVKAWAAVFPLCPFPCYITHIEGTTCYYPHLELYAERALFYL